MRSSSKSLIFGLFLVKLFLLCLGNSAFFVESLLLLPTNLKSSTSWSCFSSTWHFLIFVITHFDIIQKKVKIDIQRTVKKHYPRKLYKKKITMMLRLTELPPEWHRSGTIPHAVVPYTVVAPPQSWQCSEQGGLQRRCVPQLATADCTSGVPFAASSSLSASFLRGGCSGRLPDPEAERVAQVGLFDKGWNLNLVRRMLVSLQSESAGSARVLQEGVEVVVRIPPVDNDSRSRLLMKRSEDTGGLRGWMWSWSRSNKD